MRLRSALIALAAGAALAASCSDGSVPVGTPPPAPEATPAPLFDDFGLVGRPQNRAGIGDVELVFDRYESSRADMIELYRAQAWFKDGLTRDEALFVERGLTFVAKYDGPRRARIDRQTVERKLYKYERVKVREGEIELLLIYRAGQDADREMTILKQVIPVLESLMDVQFPERVLTVVNGDFEINDFNEGQFIRIADCCETAPFILAHELAHAYWSIGPSWLNEGMADLYANFTLEELNRQSPPGWRRVSVDLDSYYRSRKAAVESRFPDLTLPRRLASNGLYEAADVFFLDIRSVIGPEAFFAAAREIYLASDFGRYILREKRIQDIFLKHAQGAARDQVMALFNRQVWGDNGERYRQLHELEGS
ncbi:MAG TPA: hypothetical protein VNN10_03580 [Dehalococcoidia bacterium]|nr:hypothetical protein [Dehalococcoidia bacterium]